MRTTQEDPRIDRWEWYRENVAPTPQAADRNESPETLLVGPDGKTPLIQRVPRPLGFRPPADRSAGVR